MKSICRHLHKNSYFRQDIDMYMHLFLKKVKSYEKNKYENIQVICTENLHLRLFQALN